jgi:chromosome segregation ATPase
MTIKIFNYGDEDTVHVDINKYLTFEYILEDAEKEIEAKDVELACYRIRHFEANQHMNEQDKKIEELEKANKALLDQVQALKTHIATQRVECLERCNDNQEAIIKQLKTEHEGTIANLRQHINYLTNSLTELNKREVINNIEKHNREVDACTIARLNQLNKNLLDRLEKEEATVIVKTGLHETAMEVIAKLEKDLEMARWQTKSIASTVRAAAGIVNELYKRGDLKGVSDALTLMSKPYYLEEYCRD